MNLVCPVKWQALCRVLPDVSSKHPICCSSRLPSILHLLRTSSRPIYSLSTKSRRSADLPAIASPVVTTETLLSPVKIAHFSTNLRSQDNAPILAGFLRLTERKTFSKNEITSIFGQEMDVGNGNQLLHLVQEQRIAGTIDQDIPKFRRQKPKALAWLRNNYPFDEEQAILRRLDREELATVKPQAPQSDSVYGNPIIDQIRKRNLAKQAKKHAEKAKAETESTSDLPVSATKAIAAREERLAARTAWYEKYRKKVEESGQKSVPQMSFIRRVGPASLMAFGVISLCAMFAQNYTPPPRAARLFSEVPMAMATVGALIIMNVAVFIAWRYPPLWQLMYKVFLLVPAYPYPSSLLGNLFSHQNVWHLVSNMIALWFIGTKLHEDIGRGPFLALYFGCGVAASHFLLVFTVIRKDWRLTSLGCSGIICALLAVWLYINAERGIRIWPLPPAATEAMQPLYVLAFFIFLDCLRLRRGLLLRGLQGKLRFAKDTPDKHMEEESRVDHVSHLAGYLFGILAAVFVQPEVRTKPRQQNTSREPVPVMELMEVAKPSKVSIDE
ncbi:MAG: hypothetical protein Q9182_003150 [Xanthomendoza sp. 2 TL-2023]